LDLNWSEKLAKFYIWSVTLYSADTWKLRKVDRKYLESFEVWCWRKTEKIIWTDRVRNEEVLRKKSQWREEYPTNSKNKEG
jgi:hypothetical protein